MSVISDVRELYRTLHTTWSNVRVHAISHSIFFGLVFWIGSLTWINFSLPDIHAKDIADNGWLKLAKDTGVIYTAFLLPVLFVSVYLTFFDVSLLVNRLKADFSFAGVSMQPS